MSFLPISEENQQAPVGQTTSQPGQPGGQPPPASTSGGSAGSAGGGAPTIGAGGASGGSPTQFGSSASKLGDYLSANAPQVQQQATNLAGTLNTQYNNANQGITDAANQFQSQVGQGYAASNQGAVNQAIADPTKFASDPNNVKAFQGQYNDTYTGPTNFAGSQGYGDVQNQVQAGQTQGNLLNSSGGLQSYFQNQGGNQTQATSGLDALLMQGNPGANQTIQTAANKLGTLSGQLNTATAGANQSVADAQNAAAANQAYARGQFDPYVQNFSNTLNTNAQNQISTEQATNAALLKDIGGVYNQPVDTAGTKLGTYGGGTTDWGNTTNYTVNNTLSPQDLQQMGISQDQWTALQAAMGQAGTSQMMTGHNFGAGSETAQVPLAQYLAQSDPSQYINAGNVATADQYAQAAALQQLGGAGTNTGLDQANVAQAGTAPTNLNTFGYNQALQDAQNFGTNARTSAQGMANYLTGNADLAHAQSQHGGIWNTIKNTITQPGKSIFGPLNPLNAIDIAQKAAKGEVPTGDNPIPTKKELGKK